LKSLHAKRSDASVGAIYEAAGGGGRTGVAGGEVCANALNDAVVTTTDNANCETSFEDTGVLLAGYRKMLHLMQVKARDGYSAR
jgi:hypothetical protein